MKIIQAGIVKGDIIWDDLKSYYDDLAFLENKEVIVTIEEVSTISWRQHKGYRGIILPQILEAIESEGLFRFPEEYHKRQKLEVIHHFLKRMFLNTVIDSKIGKFEFETSTAGMTKDQTSQYWESIAKWYAETFKKELKMPEKPQEETH